MDYDFIEIGTSDFNTCIQTCKDSEIGLSIEPLKIYIDARILYFDLLFTVIVWPDLTIHTDLTHTSRNQLSVLRSKIDDQNAMSMNIICHGMNLT